MLIASKSFFQLPITKFLKLYIYYLSKSYYYGAEILRPTLKMLSMNNFSVYPGSIFNV